MVLRRVPDAVGSQLPQWDAALIQRAEHVRAWLQSATGCGCQSIDECALFADPALPAKDARSLAITHVGAA